LTVRAHFSRWPFFTIVFSSTMADTTTPPPPLPETAEPTVEVVNPRRKPNLTPDEIKRVISALLVGSERDADNHHPPILRRGIFSEVAQRFGVSRSQIHRIWKRAKTNYENPNVKAFRATPQKKGNSGRPRLYDPDELRATIQEIPLSQRTSLRKLAAAVDMPTSSLFSVMKRGKVEEDDPIIRRPYSSAIKPVLGSSSGLGV
jgi:transposase-like protein